MSLQKIFPVLTSIVIIIAVAVLRDRSRTLAAILATMPINIPLALWVLASGSDNDPKVLSDFVRALMIGLIPSWLWLGVVFLGVRAGWNVLWAIAAGYVVWAVVIGGLWWFGFFKAG